MVLEALSDDVPPDAANEPLKAFVNRDAFFSSHPQLADRILAAGELRRLGDGETAGGTGEATRTITGLVDGALVAWLPIEDGSFRPVHVLRDGAWLVSNPLIQQAPRRVTFTASGSVRLLHIEQDGVDALLAAHPELWRWISRIVALHLDRALDICVGLLADRPITRIASRLLALTSDDDGAHVAVELKQSDLALLSGLSRNTVSRMLGQLEGRGLIARGYRRLRVLDRNGLARIAAGVELG